MKDVACELSRTFIHLLCLFRRPQSNLKIQQVSNGEMNYEIYLMEYYIVIKLFTESEATWKIHIMVHEKENTNIYTQYACHELHNNEKKNYMQENQGKEVHQNISCHCNICGTDTPWFCNHLSYSSCFVSGVLHLTIFLVTEAQWTGVFREQPIMTCI